VVVPRGWPRLSQTNQGNTGAAPAIFNWRYEAECLSCEWVACSVCGARFGADMLVEERFE